MDSERLPVDPDVVGTRDRPDLFRRRPEPVGSWLSRAPGAFRRDGDVLAVIAVGGGLGSILRYAVAQVVPTGAPGFPWSTYVVNAVGCVLIGVLMVFVTDVWRPGRYLRPFLGVGVLGGLTTYSTAMLDVRMLGAGDEWLLAAAYLVGSLVTGLVGVWLGVAVTRVATRTRTRQDREIS